MTSNKNSSLQTSFCIPFPASQPSWDSPMYLLLCHCWSMRIKRRDRFCARESCVDTELGRRRGTCSLPFNVSEYWCQMNVFCSGGGLLLPRVSFRKMAYMTLVFNWRIEYIIYCQKILFLRVLYFRNFFIRNFAKQRHYFEARPPYFIACLAQCCQLLA